jgi:hypothetical protein
MPKSRSTIAPNYTYTGMVAEVNAISGTVIEGRGPIRKGEAYRSPARQSVIFNRHDGILASITILDGSGRRVCKVEPGARIL